MNPVIHKKYLPFTRDQLSPHFRDERHLDQLVESSRRHISYMNRYQDLTEGMPITSEVKRERQIEKDERARTITAIKTAYDNQSLSAVLKKAFDINPLCQIDDWTSLLGEKADLTLTFEVGLTSPVGYRDRLRQRYKVHDPELNLLPYLSDAAKGGTNLEGATRVNALLVNRTTDFAVMFEAKFLSDTSTSVTFDPFRNQIIRNIDVLLDEASEPLNNSPSRRYFCLLTPEVFRRRPRSRHYGALFVAYTREPSLISDDLPHRDRKTAIEAGSRIGWATYEDCEYETQTI